MLDLINTSQNRSERSDWRGARRAATETYRTGRRQSEHRATKSGVRAAGFQRYFSWLALKHIGKLFGETLEACSQTIDVMRIAVVSHHCRDRRKQAHRGCHQRFGDAGCHMRQRRLTYICQAAKRAHDAPYCTEQAHIRTDRTYRS